MAKKKRKAKAHHKPTPKPATLSAQATQLLQQEISQSPLWVKMVAEFGEAEATRLLQQLRLYFH